MKVVDINCELYKLIDLVIIQDRQAQKVLYTRYAPKLLSTCRQYIVDVQIAEDVMVTSFMKIFVHLSKYENRGNFEAWIRRIAINECISFIRANKKVRYVEECDITSEHSSADGAVHTEDIQQMIDKLPYGCKMVFNLFAVEGYKHMEIASLLNITEGTSKSQMAYARKLLQQMLKNDHKINHG